MAGAEVMIGRLPVPRVLTLELFVAVITNARETRDFSSFKKQLMSFHTVGL